MKKVMVLVEDYWHHKNEIEPLAKTAFPESGFELTVTERPEEVYEAMDDLDLFVSFKDPVENDQIPTPIWCDDKFTDKLLARIGDGMGFMCCHAALTDMPKEHRIVTCLTRSMFVMHPPQCPMKFLPVGSHEVLNGVGEFDFPEIDEHYVMEMNEGADKDILAYTTSEHGRQPALWLKEYGKGKVCCLTPAHNTANLLCDGYLKLFGNIVGWCLK